MPRCFATTSALALALLGACTPTGEPPGEGWEKSPFGWRRHVEPREGAAPRADASTRGPVDPTCGAIAVEPTGLWQRDGVRMDEVRRTWHPRAEYGQPVAIREATAPFELPGHTFLQVQVSGAPRAIQPCFLRNEVSEVHGFPECVPAWQLVYDATPEARPRTNEQWSQLLGVLDSASAVYPDDATLDRCVSELPAEVRAKVPSLGLRIMAGEQHVDFVERIDVGGALTMLVAVHATLEEGRLDVEHRELWTINREVAR